MLSTLPCHQTLPETEAANLRIEPTADDKANVGAEFVARGVEKVDVGSDREGEESVKIVEEKQGGTKEIESKRRGRKAGKAKARSEGSGSKSREGGGSEEEEEAVAVIAQVLMKKYGPQIVREEVEEGAGIGENGGVEEVKGEEAAAQEKKDGMDKEMKEEEAEADASEEGSPGTASHHTRATTLSSLLSLYRFFSSHLGISSPSSVASLLATQPSLLRSDPTSDFLPRVRLLQSFGISQADIVRITSFTSPGTPSIATSVLQRAPTILSFTAENILTKLQFFVGLVGEEAAGKMVRTFPQVLKLSKENVQGKVAMLADLIGQENTVRMVAQFSLGRRGNSRGTYSMGSAFLLSYAFSTGAGGEGGGGLPDLSAAAGTGAAIEGGRDSVSATSLLICPLLLPDGTGGGVAATAASARAAAALPLLDPLQLLLWVAVSPAVAEELLFRGLLLMALQERLGRIDAAMLSAALFARFHLSLARLFPNMALGIAAGLLAVYSNSDLPAVALHTTLDPSALIYALMAATIASV
ncbi:unnamed protein product [Closterium sp. Naga37s-1]|nr:unnamed protein product [Closterium sp. Naga37s-1]